MKYKALIIVVAAGLVTGGVAAALVNNDQPSKQSTKVSDSQSAQTDQDPSVSQGRITEYQATPAENLPTPPNPSTKKTVTPTINSVDQTANTVTLRAIVSGATTGTCTLSFSKTGQNPVELQAPLTQAPTYYICQGFDVPKTSFPIKGEWQVVVKFDSDSAQGQSETKAVVIN